MSDIVKPGKPHRVGDLQEDQINIEWEPSIDKSDSKISFQLRYKDVTSNKSSNWQFHKDCLSQSRFKLTKIEPKSKFVFQVRMLSGDDEGPYSEISDEIETLERATVDIELGSDIFHGKRPIKRKCLSFTEDKHARDKSERIRKLVIGHKSNDPGRTILILGPTGGGKSTMIEAMVNYIFKISWESDIRYTLDSVQEKEDVCNKNNQAFSQTCWITCYQIYPMEENNLKYPLTIIDSPGYGSVDGVEADQKTTNQIDKLFTALEGNGIDYLDAVCFVIKAPDGRFPNAQKYIFNSILSIFQKDIIDVFFMFVTFADGKPPVVLSALEAVGLPHNKYYSFNNSALFAANTERDTYEWKRSQLDWEMGEKSFKSFFNDMEATEPKDIGMSKEVLKERKMLNITIENMRDKLDAAMAKLDEFRNEVGLLKLSEEIILVNRNFTYKAIEHHYGQFTSEEWNLNCRECKSTCHKRCKAWNINYMLRRCDAMENGKCSQCEKKCPAEKHVNERFIHSYQPVEVEKTYEEMKERYNIANTEMHSHQRVITMMEREMECFENEIEAMIDKILKSKQRLEQIALRKDPLTMTDLLDAWITEEKIYKREGWKERTKTFKSLRYSANMPNIASQVARQLKDARMEAKMTVEEKSGLFRRLFTRRRLEEL